MYTPIFKLFNQKLSFSFVAVLLFGLMACEKNDDQILNSINSSVLYFNSFEETDDLMGVEGNAFSLSNENTGESGDSSLLVTGGCIGPHFNLDLGPFEDDKKLTFNFMGKIDHESCGVVTLRSMSSFESIHVVLDNTPWTYYESMDTMLLPQNEVLRIEIMSGGIAACYSYIDLLTIVEH